MFFSDKNNKLFPDLAGKLIGQIDWINNNLAEETILLPDFLPVGIIPIYEKGKNSKVHILKMHELQTCKEIIVQHDFVLPTFFYEYDLDLPDIEKKYVEKKHYVLMKLLSKCKRVKTPPKKYSKKVKLFNNDIVYMFNMDYVGVKAIRKSYVMIESRDTIKYVEECGYAIMPSQLVIKEN
jgi:hypothetical protein